MKPEEHGRIVSEGYDKIAEKYHEDRDQFNNRMEIEEFIEYLPSGGTILDVGCGGGIPVLKILRERGFNAKGIDFSHGMLELARKNVPDAELILGDITKAEFDTESLDGIVSTYAMIHIHRSLHSALYRKMFRWLKHSGVMLVSTAITDWEEVAEYFGVSMAWSHPAADESLKMVVNGGFTILFERPVTTGDETHYWILARKD